MIGLLVAMQVARAFNTLYSTVRDLYYCMMMTMEKREHQLFYRIWSSHCESLSLA